MSNPIFVTTEVFDNSKPIETSNGMSTIAAKMTFNHTKGTAVIIVKLTTKQIDVSELESDVVNEQLIEQVNELKALVKEKIAEYDLGKTDDTQYQMDYEEQGLESVEGITEAGKRKRKVGGTENQQNVNPFNLEQ